MKKLNWIKLATVIFCGLIMAGSMFAATPTQTIKNANTKLASAVKAAKTDAAAIEAVSKVLASASDFSSMANSVTSSFCEKLTAKQCTEFNETFINLVKVSTASKLKGYKSEKISYTGEKIEGSTATVKTTVKSGDNTVNIDYILKKSGSNWLIINYVVEDINTVDNYKKQFKRLFKKNSFDEVMQNLNKRITKIKSGK